MPNKTPEWVLETPRDFNCVLTMYDPAAGDHTQEVDLTRNEYILLKKCVAILHGHLMDEQVDRAALQSLIPDEEEDETAAEEPEPSPAAEEPSDVPAWVNYKSDNWFELSEYIGSSGETVIKLTRSEFHRLKAHLARMRGFIPQAPRSEQ